MSRFCPWPDAVARRGVGNIAGAATFRLGKGRLDRSRTSEGGLPMRLNEITYGDAAPIDGYGPGFFRVGGQVHEGAVAVLPRGTRGWGGLEDAETLLAVAGDLDVLFVGTGAEVAHIPAALRDRLEGAGLAVEAMASPAACRTYNVLLSEGRRVGAALLPV